MRIKFYHIVVFSLIVNVGTSNAITLKKTPIQSSLAYSISSNFENVSLANAEYLSDEFSNEAPKENKKNVSMLKAGLYSALLPGLGEYYVGHRSKARVFFAVEAATWISFFTFHFYGNWKEDDYIEFAATKANAELEDKNDEFRDWVGFYESIDQFNSLGRVSDPDRPYLVDNSSNHWQWQSQQDQEVYRHLKNRSREAHRRRDFMVGLAIVTRVVSIIDAVRDAKRSQRTLDDSEFSLVGNVKYRLEVNPFDNERPLSMSLFTRF